VRKIEMWYNATFYFSATLSHIELTPDDDECGAVSENGKWQRKLKYLGRTCPNATLSTVSPT
jgi:hypothetical protein